MALYKTRERIFKILEKAEAGDIPSHFFDNAIIVLIGLNIAAIILESFNALCTSYQKYFDWFEVFSISVFSVEYVLRIITSDFKYPDKKRFTALVMFVFSFMAIVDLIAIIPFYLPMIFRVDLRFLKILRLTRLVRIIKIHRYTESIDMIITVGRKKKEELLVTIFITFLLLLLASSIMYHVENNDQPQAFPNIIATFWWAVATLTTVGYGDVYPVTVMGKILSGIIALLGIGLVALPTGIISSGFMEEIVERRAVKEAADNKKCFCPYCGNKLE